MKICLLLQNRALPWNHVRNISLAKKYYNYTLGARRENIYIFFFSPFIKRVYSSWDRNAWRDVMWTSTVTANDGVSRRLPLEISQYDYICIRVCARVRKWKENISQRGCNLIPRVWGNYCVWQRRIAPLGFSKMTIYIVALREIVLPSKRTRGINQDSPLARDNLMNIVGTSQLRDR